MVTLSNAEADGRLASVGDVKFVIKSPFPKL